MIRQISGRSDGTGSQRGVSGRSTDYLGRRMDRGVSGRSEDDGSNLWAPGPRAGQATATDYEKMVEKAMMRRMQEQRPSPIDASQTDQDSDGNAALKQQLQVMRQELNQQQQQRQRQL